MQMKSFRRTFGNVPKRGIAILDGARVPFMTSGSEYKDLMSFDLARIAIQGLLSRQLVDVRNEINSVIWGTVIQEVRTSNIARESALSAGLSVSIPASTVSQACISSSKAITDGAIQILANKSDLVLCGGSETFSDVPIRFSKAIRKKLLASNKAKKSGPLGILKLLKGFKFKDLIPEPPAIKNFSTDEVMGHSSDRLSARFAISRQDQDLFALQSHQNAHKAHESGLYRQEIIPVFGKTRENGIRSESTIESLSKLNPAFIKPHGTHTAANSSFLTDGAAAVLLSTEEKAKQLGIPVKSILRDFVYVGVDPFESMLLGPSLAIERLLANTKESVGIALGMKDIDVIEFHEAFAGQVLANIRKLEQQNIHISMDKVNRWGGSLSLGHPFGATGARLVTTASNRLIHEQGRFAVVAACADGGLGHACLIERVE